MLSQRFSSLDILFHLTIAVKIDMLNHTTVSVRNSVASTELGIWTSQVLISRFTVAEWCTWTPPVVYKRTPWTISTSGSYTEGPDGEMRRERAARRLILIVFLPSVTAFNKYMSVAPTCSRHGPHSWDTSGNRRDNYCPWWVKCPSHPPKGLQFSRCFNLTRVCCSENRGQSLLLTMVRSAVAWKGAGNWGLFSSNGCFTKQATPQNLNKVPDSHECSIAWEIGQKMKVHFLEEMSQSAKISRGVGWEWGVSLWSWDDTKLPEDVPSPGRRKMVCVCVCVCSVMSDCGW